MPLSRKFQHVIFPRQAQARQVVNVAAPQDGGGHAESNELKLPLEHALRGF